MAACPTGLFRFPGQRRAPGVASGCRLVGHLGTRARWSALSESGGIIMGVSRRLLGIAALLVVPLVLWTTIFAPAIADAAPTRPQTHTAARSICPATTPRTTTSPTHSPASGPRPPDRQRSASEAAIQCSREPLRDSVGALVPSGHVDPSGRSQPDRGHRSELTSSSGHSLSNTCGLASTTPLRTQCDRRPTRRRATVGAPHARWSLG